MLAHLECLSHTPLLGHHDPAQNLLDEVFAVQKAARERIAAFKPDLPSKDGVKAMLEAFTDKRGAPMRSLRKGERHLDEEEAAE